MAKMRVRVTISPGGTQGTVTIDEEGGKTHSATWTDEEVLSDVQGDRDLLHAVMIAWAGADEFEISRAELRPYYAGGPLAG